MKIKFYLFLSILISFLSEVQCQTVYTSVSSGAWHDPTTWSPNGVPGGGDIVIIESYTVTISTASGHAKVDSIYISNPSGSSNTSLIVAANAQLTCRSIHMIGKDHNKDLFFQVLDKGIVTVTDNFLFDRSSDNNSQKAAQVSVDGGTLNVGGDFKVNYENSKHNEKSSEIDIKNNAELNISGSFEMTIINGVEVLVSLDNSKISVAKKLLIQSKTAGTLITLDIVNNSKIDVDGDIEFRAAGDGDVSITVRQSSDLIIGGDFIRPDNYGALLIDDNSLLTYDGGTTQVIACGKLLNSGTDSFNIQNIAFANTSGSSMQLEGDLVVSNSINLNDGVFQTSETAMLILEDSATISGGSSIAYIDGPMMKKGSTLGSSFVFPLGNNGVYAPLEISAVSDPNASYQAQYFSDPPPLENGISAPLSNISTNGYWSISKSAGADDVNVSLHWSDADAAGISTPDSLLVAGLKDNGDGTSTWESFGNGGTTGGVGVGVNGSVQNGMSEPPPMDEVDKLTIGSTNSGANALPVVLTDLSTKVIEQKVDLMWRTASELNASHFIIERSQNGIRFEKIGEAEAIGTVNYSQEYLFEDNFPRSGVNYYRLKQYDLDGSYTYSEVVSAEVFSSSLSLQALPNLVVENVELIGFDTKSRRVTVQVYDLLGVLQYEGEHDIENGSIRLLISEMNLNLGGFYHFVINENGKMKSVKVYIQSK